jgi:hypothetical protein
MKTDGKVKTTRLNLDVGPRSRESLERLSEATDQSYSELIRNALDLYDQLHTLLSEDPRQRLAIFGPDSEKTEILLPGFGLPRTRK